MITIKLIAITVTLVLGLKIVMSDGMLLQSLGRYFEQKIDEGYKWADLFYCQWCMTTLQSLMAHVFAIGLGIIPFVFNWQLLIRVPLIIAASSFIAGNLWNLYEISNRIKEKNEAQTDYYNVKKDELKGNS